MEFDLKNVKCQIPKNKLQKLFPESYSGKIIQAQILSNDGVYCTLRMPFFNKAPALQWLKDFQEQNNVIFRVMRTHQENTQKIIYKKEFRCVYNAKSRKSKTADPLHINCNAKLTITIKQPKMKKSQDIYLKTYPCEILLRHCHNHPLDSSVFKEHQLIPEKPKKPFLGLFKNGHSPQTALNIFKTTHTEDRSSFYPNRDVLKKQYDEPSEMETAHKLQQCIIKYNEECGDVCALMDETETTTAICTPVMKRVHQYVETARNVVFVDSSGNTDNNNVKVWLLLCPSVVETLPLGVIIASAESKNSLQNGMNLFKKMLDSRDFSPDTIISDCDTDHKEITASFTSANVFLCKYHVLNKIMKFLWSANNGLNTHNKISIYNSFQKALHCTTESEFVSTYERLLNDRCVLNNEKVFTYLKSCISKVQLWALCYRNNKSTTDYLFNTYKIFKNELMCTKKPYSLIKIFKYVTSSLEQHYFDKINDAIHDHKEINNSLYYVDDNIIQGIHCDEMQNGFYYVSSQGKEFIVNREIELCTCNLRNKWTRCKHLFAVMKKYASPDTSKSRPLNKSFKEVLYKVLGQCDKSNSTDLPYGYKTEEPSSADDPNRVHLSNKLQNFVSVLMTKYHNNFDYGYAINTFINNFEECKTELELISALQTFGVPREENK